MEHIIREAIKIQLHPIICTARKTYASATHGNFSTLL
jgi:hypothetical protein